MRSSAVVRVIADDPRAEAELKALAESHGWRFDMASGAGPARFTLTKLGVETVI